MKKKYVTPCMKVEKIATTSILQSSYIPVGGSGKPKAKLFDDDVAESNNSISDDDWKQ